MPKHQISAFIIPSAACIGGFLGLPDIQSRAGLKVRVGQPLLWMKLEALHRVRCSVRFIHSGGAHACHRPNLCFNRTPGQTASANGSRHPAAGLCKHFMTSACWRCCVSSSRSSPKPSVAVRMGCRMWTGKHLPLDEEAALLPPHFLGHDGIHLILICLERPCGLLPGPLLQRHVSLIHHIPVQSSRASLRAAL